MPSSLAFEERDRSGISIVLPRQQITYVECTLLFTSLPPRLDIHLPTLKCSAMTCQIASSSMAFSQASQQNPFL